ncbi:MAG: hypothetical protein JWO96_253, partial [Candidatus Saccharibacteria bacterium]|nr:hypothetical protein [Candidatus Saccharibacteria bacterium]
ELKERAYALHEEGWVDFDGESTLHLAAAA